jgi:hypothetical protein
MSCSTPRLALLAAVLLGTAAGAQADPPLLVGPFAKDEYPRAVIDRPLTLPAGMVENEVGFRFLSVAPESQFNATGFDDWDADGAVRVGVTELEAGTSFSLDHTERGGASSILLRPNVTSWSRRVPFRVSFLALDTDALDTAVALTLPFVAHVSRQVRVGRGPTFTIANSDGRVLPEVQLAAPTRWRFTDWL